MRYSWLFACRQYVIASATCVIYSQFSVLVHTAIADSACGWAFARPPFSLSGKKTENGVPRYVRFNDCMGKVT